MIRKDANDIDDETFLKIIKPAEEKIKNYVVKNFIYDYVAYCLATYYKMDAMWEDSLEQEINSVLCELCNYEGIALDYDKIKNILEKEHKIRVINEKPLKIEEL